MNRHKLGLLRTALWLAILVALSLTGTSAQASEEPPFVQDDAASALGPEAAWEPPPVTITRQASTIVLDWSHPYDEIVWYEAWRSENPHFDPPLAGTRLGQFYWGVGGIGTAFQFVEGNAPDCHFDAAGQYIPCQSPSPATVVGDVGHNYFWVIRAGDGSTFAYENHVGEFDFTLVKGS